MNGFLLVFLGAGLGGTARHAVNMVAMRGFGPNFPVGTMVVNQIGALLMGLLIGILAHRSEASAGIRLFLATGFLGGFTTFSTFALDAVILIERGETGAAIGYILGSVLLSLLALGMGVVLARILA